MHGRPVCKEKGKTMLCPHVAMPLFAKGNMGVEYFMYVQGKEKTEPERAGLHASSSQLRQVLINRCESMSPRVCHREGFVYIVHRGFRRLRVCVCRGCQGASVFFEAIYDCDSCMYTCSSSGLCCALRVCDCSTCLFASAFLRKCISDARCFCEPARHLHA